MLLDKRILQQYTLTVISLPNPLIFDWDEGNIKKNFKKHSVTVQESEEVFSNEPFFISEDMEHSTNEEQRFEALGKTKENRMLFVSFTVRNTKVRFISIRDMSRKEEVTYETIEKNS